MRRRVAPRTVSKRFARKLRRSKNPYILWLKCKRPHVYARLRRMWTFLILEHICRTSPIDTPFFSMAPKVDGRGVQMQWALDA